MFTYHSETTDVPADSSTTAFISVSDIFDGRLTENDHDWIAVDLIAGESYQFSLLHSADYIDDPMTQIDFRFSLRDAAGTVLGYSDAGLNYAPSVDKGASFRFVAETTGRFYLSAEEANGDYREGDYTVFMRLSDISHAPISALLWGEDYPALEPDGPVKVHFYDPGKTITMADVYFGDVDVYTATSLPWTEPKQHVIESIFDQVATFTNLTFEQITSPAEAAFKLALMDQSYLGAQVIMHGPSLDTFLDNSLGYYPSPEVGETYGAEGFFGLHDTTDFWQPDLVRPGGEHYLMLLNEIGFGLGLAFASAGIFGSNRLGDAVGNSDTGLFELNQGVFTVMGGSGWADANLPRTETSGNAMGFGALDIGALQALYGRNMAHATGNDHYAVSDLNGYKAIWDAGGEDTLWAKTPADAALDLRAATLRYEDGGGGYVSHVSGSPGGLTIAKHTLIENARTGSGADVVEGNYVANDIRTGDGNDLVRARNGNDVVVGDAGNDEIHGGAGDDWLYGNSGLDALFGDGGNDRIRGNRGEDTLDGGAGNDVMLGGGSDDILLGGDGDDWLHGGGREDALTGGTGDDVLIGDWGSDVFIFAPGDGRDVIRDFTQGDDLIDLSAHGLVGVADILAVAEDRDGFIKIVLGAGDVLYLDGLETAELLTSDFVF